MKFVAAIDSFKGSVSSYEAGEACKAGILKVLPGAEVKTIAVADGGEGTVDALLALPGCSKASARVHDPLGNEIDAEYAILELERGRAALIESAACIGLPMVPADKRNPMFTDSFGLGECIMSALDDGIRSFIIALGGSSTNDCGLGMLFALSARRGCLLNRPVGCAGLDSISGFDTGMLDPRLKECVFCAACDVNNPLCGPDGASYVFAPQKGARPEDLPLMDAAHKRFALLSGCETIYERNGYGAAGGLGFAIAHFLNGRLLKGFDLIADLIGLENEIKSADCVFTGEGCLDMQSLAGKVPYSVASMCKKYGVPCYAIAGKLKIDEPWKFTEAGIREFRCINEGVELPLEELMKKEVAYANITNCVSRIVSDVSKSITEV